MEDWDGIRTALAVARAGTVSGAASALGVHHATVIRHIDALEDRLGARLFQRHPRGYSLTEAGQTLMDEASAADARFAQMAARIAGSGDRIEGEIVVTALPDLTEMIMPRLIELMRANPGLRLRYMTDIRLYRLDTGEAHIAIRAGARPTEPDYIAQPLMQLHAALYGSPAYVEEVGMIEDVSAHRFILPGPEARRSPAMRWLADQIPPENVVLVSNDFEARLTAIRAGLGLGWVSPMRATGLVEVLSLSEWDAQFWLVTHVDLHRTAKVQAVLSALKAK
ncbi:LysR family transcriptional regulator [Paracoccus zhejiangensis]|uniref:LysR family transcriptional regulator n=1 Tax=Paracoccus zhejiangensis TaxID=1077935 RepID=A0A2H5F4I3_9RHOB|nr:LysR family transcriptional regulator [Paracoccus zhejiangensis]AUH66450.1 LysR family transcriptional regulator [Paracoccus zhejiangensis]